MSSQTAVSDTEVQSPKGESSRHDAADWTKVGIGVVGMVLVVWGLANLFLAFGYHPEWFHGRVIIGLLALIGGVGGAVLLFHFLNMFVEGLPAGVSARVMPYAYVLPGIAFITVMLLYPAIQTINYSFANADSTAYVGFDNYRDIFANHDFRSSILNNVLWLLIVPALAVAIGLAVAVLADKLSTTGEKVSKSFIFVPMAISFVGASAIWGLVYAYNNKGQSQTGLLNGIWTTFGGDPQTWLQISSGRLNSLLMMVILVWLQVGFAMILLSSAIKSVPEDTLEAARIDGASEWKIFWQVVVPQIKGTMITVYVTVVILVLKVFDIVYVLTNGRSESNVIANLFFNELFANSQAGRASAIVVILLLAVMPVLYYQVRHFRAEELNR